MTAVWPLVGRRSELHAITAAARDPGSSGVLVAGPAGVGKTRLAHEVVAELDSAQYFPVQAVASGATRGIPFGALAHLLPRETAMTGPVNRVGWARDALLGRVRDGRRLVMSVDDAHLLDETSAAVVVHLARASDAFVLATVRDGEPEPDAVQSLWKDDVLERVELSPLSPQESAAMIAEIVAGHVDDGTVYRLWRVTGGNPLYLRELVLAGQEAGTLAERDGVVQWTGEVAMVPRLVELIGERLGTLDEDETAALELLAFGEPLEISMLAELSSPAAVDAVEARKLIAMEHDVRRGVARLAHPLYGDAIRAQCPALRSRRRMREIANVVESSGSLRREDTLRLAILRLESGTAHDPVQMLAACRLAWSLNDMPLAARLGWSAVNAGGGVEAASTLATILNWTGHSEEAAAVLASAESAATSPADQAQLAIARALTYWYGLDRAEEAITMLAELERTIADDEIRQPVTAQRISVLQMTGRCRAALALYDDVMAEPPATESITTLLHSLAGLAFAATGHDAAATECMDQAMAVMDLLRAITPVAEPQAVVMRHHVHLFAGDLAAADACIRPLYSRAVEEWDWPVIFGCITWRRGQNARYRGQVAQARRWCREAVAGYRRQSVVGLTPCALGELAHTCALTGDLAAAQAALAEAEATRTSSMGLYNHWIDIARTWVLACGGDVAGGVDHAVAVARRAHDARLLAFEVVAAHDAVRLGAAGHVAELLKSAAAKADGPYPTVCAAHAAATSARDGDALLVVADRLTELGMLLYAAEAAAQAAAAFQAGGDGVWSRRADGKAWSLARQCEGAWTPALAELHALSLTRSEREVAHLAAAGMTSRQIAERLVKSVRTVDNHLGKVYGKLCVESRGQLADLLGGPSAG